MNLKYEEVKQKPSSSILVEKYRPKKVKQVILPSRFKKMFNSFVDNQEIQNLIIYSSSPGSGKTTISKALARDCGYNYLYINASLHSGIATLRDEISDYASVGVFGTKDVKKVVILDEFDGTSQALQKGLRGAIEEFHDKCRFILTANNFGSIIPALKSRCMTINFDYTDADHKEIRNDIAKRLTGIANKENIKYEDGIMLDIVDNFFPDIRKMISTISEYSKYYDCITKDIFSFDVIDDQLKKLILDSEVIKARQFILDKGYKFEDLYRYLYDEVIPASKGDKCEMYGHVADYLDKSTRSPDQEITFVGCLIRVMQAFE